MTARWTMPAAALMLLAAAMPPAAKAQQPAEDVRAACTADYKRFCAGRLPGGGRILACLGEHLAELSPVCGKAVAMGIDCREDRKTYCDGVSPGNGALRQCLEQQGAKLSPACARTLAAAAKPEAGAKPSPSKPSPAN